MAKSPFYMVIESFVGTLDGKELEYQKGEVLAAEDPALAKWPHLFGPLVIRHSTTRGVEQATAAPGEKRGG